MGFNIFYTERATYVINSNFGATKQETQNYKIK